MTLPIKPRNDKSPAPSTAPIPSFDPEVKFAVDASPPAANDTTGALDGDGEVLSQVTSAGRDAREIAKALGRSVATIKPSLARLALSARVLTKKGLYLLPPKPSEEVDAAAFSELADAASAVKAALSRGGLEHPGWLPRPDWTTKSGAPNRGPLVIFINNGVDQIQPPTEVLATRIPELIRHTRVLCTLDPVTGLKYHEIGETNLLTETVREALVRATADSVCAMTCGLFPTSSVVTEATKMIEQHALPPRVIAPYRWVGERGFALHEMAPPKDGDYSAHQEFLGRCSDPEVVKAWVWTIFLPEDKTGRESLFLLGSGHDGKSAWSEVLQRFLGPLAASCELPKAEDRFSLVQAVGKRICYYGDVRNPRPYRQRVMREMISGAHMQVEQKGKPVFTAYLHPRVLMSGNTAPRIIASDRAEVSRIRLITVAPVAEEFRGDRAWKGKLMAEIPAFLHECRAAFERLVPDGNSDIPITPACLAALNLGTSEIAEEYEALGCQIEITGREEDFLPASEVQALIDKAGYSRTAFGAENARAWLRSSGARNRTKAGSQIRRTIGGAKVYVWEGVKRAAATPFANISTTKGAA